MMACRRSSVGNPADRPRQVSSCSRALAGLLGIGALIAAGLVCGLASAPPAHAQQVLAVVNGLPITSYDAEQRSKLIQLSTHKTPSKKELIEELIDDQLKIIEAKKYGIEANNTEVESAFGNMAHRMGMKPPQLAQALASHGIAVATLKARIRSDIVWGQLVRGRFQNSLLVSEPEIKRVTDQKQDPKDAVGHIFTLRPILFIVPAGSPPAAFEARRREAEALRGRFENCTQGVALARTMRDVAVREQTFRNGADIPTPLRTMLASMSVGKLTPPETTAQGVEVFALCNRQETRASSPLQEEARQEIFNKRYEAQSKRYLQEIRRGSMVEYKVGAR
jgi:peptidyl-prolyl cis-trans isomerase SurA